MDLLLSDVKAKPTDVMDALEAIAKDLSAEEPKMSADTQTLFKKLLGREHVMTADGTAALEKGGRMVAEKIGFKPGDTGIVINGRVSSGFLRCQRAC